MSDDFDPRTPPGGPGGQGEPIGNVGEEAAKLFAALSGWAKDQGTDYASTAGGAASAVSEAFHTVSEHIATDGEDCRYCPVCQVIGAIRATSPEVKANLAIAASSLMQAAAGILATQVPDQAKGSPVEKINLDEGAWDES